ncbi:hypothetical protein I6F35_06485 [Bradyrhizobium sp. BRP22]|uniref:hypothetical protein n=1 Tax=Bradyrhizobium sp. BRP22 TaxID=2793821 RepID=UPI001CD72F69|nr:hypothetical protein [Bradyrhizobium sp. BRP22]MCA1452868.1 hypothetical protein [Bradyrhizobium sp. BRP22]
MAMDERKALNIEFDFATKTATVVFPADHQFVVADVVAYFEDATHGEVMVIRIFHDDTLAQELRRPFPGNDHART